MVKINKRWAVIVAIVFTVVLAVCTIFTAKGTRKASADTVNQIQYLTQWYSMNIYAAGDSKNENVTFSIRLTRQDTGTYTIAVSTRGTLPLLIEAQGTGNIDYSRSISAPSGYTFTLQLNAFLNEQIWGGIQTADVMIIQSASTPYTYTQRINFYFGPRTGQAYVSLSWQCTNIWENFFADSETRDIIIETRTTENAESNAYDQGYIAGANSQRPAINEARQEGYNSGYAAGVQQTSSLGDILLGIGGVPFETLQSIFDFDLLGINISSLIMSILTAAIAIWIVKLFI